MSCPHCGGLTDKQQEIVRLIAKGYTSKEIADLLNLSIKTIETHRASIQKKLDVHNVAGLTRYAIRTGLVSAEE